MNEIAEPTGGRKIRQKTMIATRLDEQHTPGKISSRHPQVTVAVVAGVQVIPGDDAGIVDAAHRGAG